MTDKVERVVYYYEIKFNLLKDAEKSKRTYIEILDKVKELCDDNSLNRFIKRKKNDENKFGIYEYCNVNNLIAFKLIRMRKDVFPQLIDDNLTSLEDIANSDKKSVVESTHIVLDYSDPLVLKLGIEFNFEGPRIMDLIIYLKHIGSQLKLVRSMTFSIVSNNMLEEATNKIGDCKFLNMKVMKENVEAITKIDSELGSALDSLSKFTQSEYFNLKLRLDYKLNNSNNKSKINKFIKLFSTNKNVLNLFESFSVEAQDTSKEERVFEVFDLLLDKVKSRVKVERRDASKVIISSQMYKIMSDEYINKIS